MKVRINNLYRSLFLLLVFSVTLIPPRHRLSAQSEESIQEDFTTDQKTEAPEDPNKIPDKYRDLSEDELIREILLLEKEKQILQEKISGEEELRRILSVMEQGSMEMLENERKVGDQILFRLLEERALREQREREIEVLKRNLMFPGKGLIEKGDGSDSIRGYLWAGGFTLSLLGTIISYAETERYRHKFDRAIFAPEELKKTRRLYDHYYQQTSILAILTFGFYLGSVVDGWLFVGFSPEVQKKDLPHGNSDHEADESRIITIQTTFRF